jgi:hypothetical protein
MTDFISHKFKSIQLPPCGPGIFTYVQVHGFVIRMRDWRRTSLASAGAATAPAGKNTEPSNASTATAPATAQTSKEHANASASHHAYDHAQVAQRVLLEVVVLAKLIPVSVHNSRRRRIAKSVYEKDLNMQIFAQLEKS